MLDNNPEPDLQMIPVAKINSVVTGRNFQQDQAHIEVGGFLLMARRIKEEEKR